MNDNARPHRARAIWKCLQQEALASLPQPACSPDLHPTEHLWNILRRKIHQRNPQIQTVPELEAALHPTRNNSDINS